MATVDSVLDFNKTALIIIDLQNMVVNMRPLAPYSSSQIVSNACRLADAFESKGAFVVLTKVSTSGMMGSSLKEQDDYTHELKKYKNAYLITRRQQSAFYGTDLDLQLRHRKIETIVLCGITTSHAVGATAREAHQLGYQQIFAEDAMTAFTTEDHEYVCKHIFPSIGKILRTEEIIELLNQDGN